MPVSGYIIISGYNITLAPTVWESTNLSGRLNCCKNHRQNGVGRTDRQTQVFNMQPHHTWECKWQLSGLNIWDSEIQTSWTISKYSIWHYCEWLKCNSSDGAMSPTAPACSTAAEASWVGWKVEGWEDNVEPPCTIGNEGYAWVWGAGKDILRFLKFSQSLTLANVVDPGCSVSRIVFSQVTPEQMRFNKSQMWK